MAQSNSKFWSRLSGWGALALSVGALFGGGARAATSDLDQVAIRTEGETIYVSERGGEFQELKLGNTPEAMALRKLLAKAGAGATISVPVGSIIVANGGSGIEGPSPAAGKAVKSKQTNGKRSAAARKKGNGSR